MTLLLPTKAARRTGGEFFIAAVALLVLIQVPGNTYIALLLPLFALLWNGLRVPDMGRVNPYLATWPLWLWLGITLIASLMALIYDNALFQRNFFLLTVATTSVALFVIPDSSKRGERALGTGLWLGFSALALIGIVEVVTNNKLIFSRYPESTVLSWVATKRFLTTAVYPNYNDYAIALVLLAVFIAARFLVAPRGLVVQGARVVAVLALSGWIVYIGSRGAMLGLLVALALLVFLTERERDIRSIPSWLLTTLTATGVAVAAALSQTSYVQDENAAERGRIIERLWALASEDPSRTLLGFGSPETLTRFSTSHFSGQLLNPHNVIVESFVWGGIFGALAFVTCWGFVAWKAVTNQSGTSWFAKAATAATVSLPLLGVTPSVMLHYLFPQLLLVLAVATLRRRPVAPSSPTTPQQLARH
ncbi:O-antigen ligase family protein [Tessaracoccus sp. Z1128]